jgi:predicted signal transduction protein with EAL and GGDEF domain
MHLMSILGMLLAASHVILFTFFTVANSESEAFWRLGILTTHLILLSTQALIFTITTFVKSKRLKPTRLCIQALVAFAVGSVVAVGIALVSLDQLVTTAITPFLVICIFIAMLFTLRPLASIPLFLGTYLVYYFAIGLYQANQAILLSNRVNGLTAILMGIFLALSIWRTTTRDFLQKQFIAKQQKELEEKNNELALLAAVDGLTGLLNRRELDKSLSAVLAATNLRKQPLSLILLDIDHFKAYNDLYGHVHGDECLRR